MLPIPISSASETVRRIDLFATLSFSPPEREDFLFGLEPEAMGRVGHNERKTAMKEMMKASDARQGLLFVPYTLNYDIMPNT